jgi:hypothetical protein
MRSLVVNLLTVAAATLVSVLPQQSAQAFWGRSRVVTSYALPSVPVTTYGYAPVVAAPVVTTGYAPIVTARPVVVAPPVVTTGYAPATTTYYSPPVTTNYAPAYAPAPVSAPVTAYYPATTYAAPAPVTTYYAPAAATGVIVQQPVIVRRPFVVWP